MYLLVLFDLSNAKYPEFATLDSTKLSRTVGNSVAVYAALESASLLYVHFFMRWISTLHMVANVQERDNAVLQSVFMVRVTTGLLLTLQHVGT